MNFVFVSYNYDPAYTSPESWYARIKGYMGVLICLSKNNRVTRIKQINYEGDEVFNGVHFKFVNYGSRVIRFPWKLHRLIKRMEPDIVVVHGLHNPLQTIQLRFQSAKKTKIIVQNHAEKPSIGIKKWLQRIADQYIDAYLFASTAMGVDWVNRGNLSSPQKIHEVMEVSSVFYAIDKETARAKTGVSEQSVFLWVGRLDQNKDPLTVVRAFLKFSAINTGAHLYMIYQTNELLDDMRALLNNITTPSITLVGKIPNDELLYWYNSADFIVSGSHYEGSGTAVCEALSCGCIPVVTDIFSFRMITDNGDCGILYEAGNEASLLDALLQTKQMDRPQQRQKSLAYFESKLSFKAIAQQIQDIAASL
jgi:glycosyltransferase involved in cell wall biosynthesis